MMNNSLLSLGSLIMIAQEMIVEGWPNSSDRTDNIRHTKAKIDDTGNVVSDLRNFRATTSNC